MLRTQLVCGLLVLIAQGAPAQGGSHNINSSLGLAGPLQLAITVPRKPVNGRFDLLRFSSDGRYILAQGKSEVVLLNVRPLAIVLLHRAERITEAGFMPDSKQIWFVIRPAHVISRDVHFAGSKTYIERWRISDATRINQLEIPLRSCRSFAVSPDSKFLGCVDREGTLSFFDIDRQETIYTKKKFGNYYLIGSSDGEPLGSRISGDPGSADVYFSSDSRYGIVIPIDADGSTLAWDLVTHKQVQLRGGLKHLEAGYTADFLAPGQVLISRFLFGHPKVDGMLVSFPSGDVILRTKIAPGRLLPATDPRFALVRPFGLNARIYDSIQRTAAIEYQTGEVIISDARTLDVIGEHFVTEDLDTGKVNLYRRHHGLEASITIDSR